MVRARTPLLLSFVLLTLASAAHAADVTVTLDAGAGFSVKDNTGTTERLRVDEATGNVSRNGALFVHTTGTNSVFVGPGAGNTAGTGTANSAFGTLALASNTSGYRNSAFGMWALNNNTTGTSNAAVGAYALRFNTSGSRNNAVGSGALFFNTTGTGNSAIGNNALRSNTTGSKNIAVGEAALFANTTGTRNSAVGVDALSANTTGGSNSAVGFEAMRYNTGSLNSAFGDSALRSSTGSSNSAFGVDALKSNLGGGFNSAFGKQALLSNTTGWFNTAVGFFSLTNNQTGQYNTAVGYGALQNSTGSSNVALGRGAGSNQTTGSDNIYLENPGLSADSGQIKIGTTGTHTQATVAGISGNVVAGGSTVLVNANGQLGTIVSSSRFKESVEDLGETSERLMALRPVSFHYRKEAGGDGETTEYGLIAEEVAAVAPELVVYDDEGKPFTVRYHLLAPMLLNELQKELRTSREQQQLIGALESRLAALESQQTGSNR